MTYQDILIEDAILQSAASIDNIGVVRILVIASRRRVWLDTFTPIRE